MTEEDALRAEAAFNRLKHHYFEKYGYRMSCTADMKDVARRASTWMFVYQFMRGAFAVQYAGMTDAEIEKALEERKSGFEGGMPLGAKLQPADAIRRWLDGERAYQPTVRTEPLFVQLKGKKKLFTTTEMKMEYVGFVFKDCGDRLGFQPGASALNSGRRMAMVTVQRGAERAGFDPAMHAKKMSTHQGDGRTSSGRRGSSRRRGA